MCGGAVFFYAVTRPSVRGAEIRLKSATRSAIPGSSPRQRIGAVLDTSPITSNKEFSRAKLVIHLIEAHMFNTGTPDPRRWR